MLSTMGLGVAGGISRKPLVLIGRALTDELLNPCRQR